MRRNPTLIFFLIGLMVFVFLMGIVAFVLLQRHWHARNWTPVRATVLFSGTLCEIQYKDTRYWLTDEVVECADAERALAHRRESSASLWRSRETEYAEIAYTAAGEPRTKQVIQWMISTRPLTLGEDIGILVDPEDPANIDRPNTSDDFSFAWKTLLVALAAWAALVFFVWLVARFTSRKRQNA